MTRGKGFSGALPNFWVGDSARLTSSEHNMTSFSCIAQLALLAVGTAGVQTAGEPTAAAQPLDSVFVAQQLRRSTEGYPIGRYSMEYSAYFHEMQPAVANGLENYLFEALVESRSKLYSGNPPSSSKIDAILRERAGEHATLVRQTIPGPHTHGGPFEFAVHDGVFDYSQSFDPDERLEDEVIRSNIYLQVRPQEYIYSLTTAADEAREIPATLSATIGLTSEDTVVRMVPAPYWQTYYKSVSFLAHSFENQPRIWNVTSDSSSSTIVAVADVSSPQGPWPDIARPPLCLVSGRFEAVLDASHGGLVRYTVTNARGQVVEQLKASDFVEANGSAAPLGVEHRTYWPSESAQLRSVTSFSGTFSETDGEPRPRSILIRPGSRVIDKRVDPAIEYVEGLIPVDDQRIASIAAEAAVERDLHPMPARVDSGESVSEAPFASANSPLDAETGARPGTSNGGRRWPLALLGVVFAGIAFVVVFRKS